MKSIRTAFSILAIGTAILIQGGCATSANLNGSPTTLIQVFGVQEPEFFGGVERNANLIGDKSLFAVVDMPLTLVGDIVTLPLVYRMKNDPAVMKAWTGRTFGEGDPDPTPRYFAND